MAQYYDVAKMKQYIVANAPKYGLDPQTALKVWMGEGLSEGVWQSNIVKNGVREPSYGPFQFNTDGGMGNDFYKKTGLDPRNPANVYAMADYAMAQAGKGGWSPWYAARDQNIGPWEGISKGGYKVPAQGDQPASYSAGQFVDAFKYDLPAMMTQPGSYSGGQYVPSFQYDTNPTGPVVMSAVGGPAPASEGILAKIFGSFGKAPDPYWMKGPGWDAEARQAFRAQHLEDKGWPSLRSYLG